MRQLLRRSVLAGLAAGALAGCSGEEPSAQGSAPTGASTGPSTSASATGPGVPSPTSTNQPPTGGETDGDKPKACSLITGAEAATALGRPVGPPADQGTGASSSCAFTTTGGRPATVTVQVLQRAATSGMFDRIVASQPGGDVATPVSGVGDKAVLVTGALLFRKGSTVVTVLVVSQDGPDGHTAATVALGKKIAAKL